MFQATTICLLFALVTLVERIAGQCGGILPETGKTVKISGVEANDVCQWYLFASTDKPMQLTFNDSLPSSEQAVIVQSFGTETKLLFFRDNSNGSSTDFKFTDPVGISFYSAVGMATSFSFIAAPGADATPVGEGTTACGELVTATGEISITKQTDTWCNYFIVPPANHSAKITFPIFPDLDEKAFLSLATLTDNKQNNQSLLSGKIKLENYIGTSIISAVFRNPEAATLKVEMVLNGIAGQCGGILPETGKTVTISGLKANDVCQWYLFAGTNKPMQLTFSTALPSIEQTVIVQSFGPETKRLLFRETTEAMPAAFKFTDPVGISFYSAADMTASFSFIAAPGAEGTALGTGATACGKLVTAAGEISIGKQTNTWCNYFIVPTADHSAKITFPIFPDLGEKAFLSLATLTDDKQNNQSILTTNKKLENYIGTSIISAVFRNPEATTLKVEMGGKALKYSTFGFLVIPMLFLSSSSI